MEFRTNRREKPEGYVKGKHLKLEDLKVEARGLNMHKRYLRKNNIPVFPRVEFHISHLKHDTNGAGLQGIKTVGGFKNIFPEDLPCLWWSLAVKAEDVEAAEARLLRETFPDRTKDQVQRQQSFLGRFTTSPAFSEKSMWGSFRFTLPLDAVLKAYSEQLCSGAQPVMRVWKTALYRKEVMHAVLVHSPDDQEQFEEFPLLADDPNAVCVYKNGCFMWRPVAMSKEHNYILTQTPAEKLMEVTNMRNVEYYVWDNVAIALHIGEQVLQFDQLRENLSFCEKEDITSTQTASFETFEEAEVLVKDLWPGSESLERETPLTLSTGSCLGNAP